MNQQDITKLQQIETVAGMEPFRIVPVTLRHGTARTPEEIMGDKVRWVERTGYTVLTNTVPGEFRPYNAIIRVDGKNTEDRQLDYLALIKDKQTEALEAK